MRRLRMMKYLLFPWFLLNMMRKGKKRSESYPVALQTANLNVLIGLVAFSTLGFGSFHPTISITPTKKVLEGDSGTSTVALKISADKCPKLSNIKIHWATADGTATTSDNDYIGASGEVTFKVSLTNGCNKIKSIFVTVNGDTKIEPDETFKVVISDGGTSSIQKFNIGNSISTVTIENDDVNHPPVFTSTPSTNAKAGTPYSYTPTVEDMDGDKVTITAPALPSWLSWNGTTLSGTPSAAEVGHHYDVVLQASDGTDATEQKFTIHVNDASNNPPVADNISVETEMNTPVSFALQATDPDGDAIQSYPVLGNGPAHGTLSGPDTNITYTPDANYTGPDSFQYEACDTHGACSDPATVSITVKASGPVEDSNPPVCVDTTSYGSAGDVGACFDGPVFKGGAGCRQTVKLRNLSDEPIDNAVVAIDKNLFNGSAGGRCGIDGEDATGNDCNLTHAIQFGPFGVFNEAATFNTGNFDSRQEHSIYIESAASHDFTFLEDRTYIKYFKNGVEHVGRVQKCKVNTKAADLCYTAVNPVKKGLGLCMDFGFFSFGLATGGCGKQIVLKNQSDSQLTDVTTSLIAKDLFKGHMIDNCYMDGEKSNEKCRQGDVMDFGFMGMSGLFQGSSVTFDPMPDFDANDTHSITSLSTINMKVFPRSELYGSYIKDGQLYRGVIRACGDEGSEFKEGSMDAVDQYRDGQYIPEKGLQTKVARKNVTVDVIYLGDDMVTPRVNEAADIPVYLYLLSEDCKQLSELSDKPMATIEKNHVYASSSTFRFEGVSRANRLGMQYIDYDKLVREGKPQCLKNSSSGQNAVPGMPACVDSDDEYTQAFGEEAYQRCKVDNGQPCNPNNHGVGNAPYDNEYGCYQCTMEVVGTRVCSSDDFAIRPDRFVIGMPDPDYPNLLRSGKDYNVSLTAYDADGNVSSDYNVSNLGTWLDINQSRYFRDGSLATGSQLSGTVEINVSTPISAIGGKSTDAASEPASAKAVIPLNYDDVGKIKAHIFDKYWASVDNDDTPMDCDDSHAHTYICGEQNLTFIPDHFGVENIKVHNHNDGKVTYLSSDLSMSAHLDVNISARNAKDKITRNFRQGALYYENPLTVTLSVTDWNSSLPSPHPLGYQAITQGIASPVRLGFGGADENGTHFIHWNDANQSQQLMFNYPRKMNEPVNPFDVNGTEIQVSVASTYTDASSGPSATITGSGVGGTDSNATFAYARAKPSVFFYDDVNTTSVKTPISIEIYKNPITSSYDLNLSIFRPTEEFDWYLSTPHNPNNGDGTVALSANSNGTVSPTTVQPVNGIDTSVTVTNTGTTPDIVDIDLGTATSSWLIYNRDRDSVPTPFYRVRFIGTGGWTGHGKTGHVVGAEANSKKERRIEW